MAALDQPAYNYIIHTAPFDTRELAHYHWYIEIIPSLTKFQSPIRGVFDVPSATGVASCNFYD